MLTTRNLLLVGHIAAAIVLIGPATAAASAFPRHLLEASAGDGDGAARAMHRITRGYGAATVAVPAIGIALAAQSSLLDEPWVLASLAVVAVGGALLWFSVVPAQARLLDAVASGAVADPTELADRLRPLRATTGIASLTWFVVLVLMVVKPS